MGETQVSSVARSRFSTNGGGAAMQQHQAGDLGDGPRLLVTSMSFVGSIFRGFRLYPLYGLSIPFRLVRPSTSLTSARDSQKAQFLPSYGHCHFCLITLGTARGYHTYMYICAHIVVCICQSSIQVLCRRLTSPSLWNVACAYN